MFCNQLPSTLMRRSDLNGRLRFSMLKPVLLLAITAVFTALAQKAVLAASSADDLPAITNLLQLTQSLDANERVIRDVDLEATVVAASGPSVGAVILQDATG